MGSHTLLAGIQQVPPGTAIWMNQQGETGTDHIWTLPVSPEPPDDPFEAWVERAGVAVRAGLEGVLEGARKPFVLLSGGVDSSLLAGLGREVVEGLVAVTPTWEEHSDPELARARRYADHLGIEHRILRFNHQDMARLSRLTVEFFGGPLRDYHMVALAGVYEMLGDEGFDLVLHGQAADTVFGSGNLIYSANFEEKRRRLLHVPDGILKSLGSIVPLTSPRLQRLAFLLSHDTLMAAKRFQRLLHRPRVRAQCPRLLDERDPPPELLARADWNHPLPVPQQVGDFYQGTVSQIVTSTAISDPCGITMGYPYLTQDVLDVALRLPNPYKRRDGQAKPVMKALAGEVFPYEWGMETKLGFPTPKVAWMREGLAPWIQGRLGVGSWSRAALGEELVEGLGLPDDHELIWTLTSLEEFLGLAFPEQAPADVRVLPGS
jgi:asparagine synthetase B (glutamine-hydrolysing)